MKKLVSVLLALGLMLSLFSGCKKPNAATTTTIDDFTMPPATEAPVDYANSTVILYSANVRGNVQIYSAIAAAKAAYEALGATVYLVDAGNYLQGSAYAGGDMGLTIYDLMETVGYDVAGMGVSELVYGEAEVGYTSHGDLTKYYTQAELYRGTQALTYQQNAPWDKEPRMVTRPAKAAAGFSVICSNLAAGENATGYYEFEPYVVLGQQLKIGFVCSLPEDAAEYVREGFLDGYAYQNVTAPECDVLIALGGGNGDIVIPASADAACKVGACVINNDTREILLETVDLTATDAAVEAKLASLQAATVLGELDHDLDGSLSANQNGQTELGTLVADALKWYAENRMEGIEYPVVGIQSGGNCTGFLYRGEVTELDLRNVIHASNAGVGVIYLTGAQLLEALEASTQQADCPAWAQVSGISYTVDTQKPYDASYVYGHYFKAGSVNRVQITTENFDLEATYAVVADMQLLLGGDTYYIFRDCAVVAETEAGLSVCDIVAMYLQEGGAA